MKKDSDSSPVRYGENPHQKGWFDGDIEELFEQLNGKELSYNNFLDIDAAVNLIADFDEPTLAILKHNNACGLASRPKLIDAWRDALAGDPISAFGGIVITNQVFDLETAKESNKLLIKIIIAPDFEEDALMILREKKDMRIMKQKKFKLPDTQFRSILNGVLKQEKDLSIETRKDMKVVTKKYPTDSEYVDLEFANKIVKHTKSNAIVLVKNKQLLSSGTGMTSRIDALKFAIQKTKNFNFDLNDAVMASDAFFPFPDCVEVAHKEGVRAVIQPGGSKKDQDSIDYCNDNDIAMVTTGIRHFKH